MSVTVVTDLDIGPEIVQMTVSTVIEDLVGLDVTDLHLQSAAEEEDPDPGLSLLSEDEAPEEAGLGPEAGARKTTGDPEVTVAANLRGPGVTPTVTQRAAVVPSQFLQVDQKANHQE